MYFFQDADAAFMVGAFPRKEGMERKDLLSKNITIFKVTSKENQNSIFTLTLKYSVPRIWTNNLPVLSILPQPRLGRPGYRHNNHNIFVPYFRL